MSAAVVTAVYDWLAADSGAGGFANATGGVGSRLYHVTGPEDVALPACVFTLSGAVPERMLSSTAAEERWTMDASIWTAYESSDPASALEIDRRLFVRLEGVSLTATGYDRLRVTCLQRGACAIDEDGYRVDSRWLVRGVRTS